MQNGLRRNGIDEGNLVWNYLQDIGMVEGMSNCNSYFDFCEHCLYGKKNRVNLLVLQGKSRS